MEEKAYCRLFLKRITDMLLSNTNDINDNKPDDRICNNINSDV